MAYIPVNKELVGRRIRLIKDIEAVGGIYIKGHIFSIEDCREEGYDLIDDEGHGLIGCPPENFEFIKESKSGSFGQVEITIRLDVRLKEGVENLAIQHKVPFNDQLNKVIAKGLGLI